MKKVNLFAFAIAAMSNSSLYNMAFVAPGKNKEATQEIWKCLISQDFVSEKAVYDKVKRLLDQGADANARIKPLYAGVYNSVCSLFCIITSCSNKNMYSSLIPLFVEYGADVNGRCGVYLPLHNATGNYHKAQELLKCGARVNAEDFIEGYTPFMLGNRETAKLLLSYGAMLSNGNRTPSEEQEALFTQYCAFIEFKRGMLGLKPLRDALNKLQWSENVNGRKLYAARRDVESRQLPDEIVAYIGELLGYPEPIVYTDEKIATFKGR